MAKEKDPLDVRFAEFLKKTDIVQMVGGVAYAVFVSPIVGLAAAGIGFIQYRLESGYIKKRRGGRQQAGAGA